MGRHLEVSKFCCLAEGVLNQDPTLSANSALSWVKNPEEVVKVLRELYKVFMTSTNIANAHPEIANFQQFGADEQLALLWFIYEEIKGSITPKGGPDTAGFEIAQGVVDQIQQGSQEEQLQAQRDILAAQGSGPFVEAYADMNSSTRIAFWYLLAQRMEEGSVIQVPADYQLPSEAQNFLQTFQGWDFNDQITFIRNLVSLMGPSTKEGAVV